MKNAFKYILKAIKRTSPTKEKGTQADLKLHINIQKQSKMDRDICKVLKAVTVTHYTHIIPIQDTIVRNAKVIIKYIKKFQKYVTHSPC